MEQNPAKANTLALRPRCIDLGIPLCLPTAATSGRLKIRKNGYMKFMEMTTS